MGRVYETASAALARALTFELADLKREQGQGAVEYALVVLGVAAIIAAAVAGFTNQIASFMSSAGAALASYV